LRYFFGNEPDPACRRYSTLQILRYRLSVRFSALVLGEAASRCLVQRGFELVEETVRKTRLSIHLLTYESKKPSRFEYSHYPRILDTPTAQHRLVSPNILIFSNERFTRYIDDLSLIVRIAAGAHLTVLAWARTFTVPSI
jgi:hypothetical protein